MAAVMVMIGHYVGAGKVVGLGDFIDVKIRYSAVERQAAQVAIMEERRSMRKRVWGFLTLVLLLAGGMAYWRLTAEPPALIEDAALPATKSNSKTDSEEEKNAANCSAFGTTIPRQTGQ